MLHFGLVHWEENNRAVSRREVMGFQFWLKRVNTNAWQREEESYRSQIWCIERISSPGSFCPSYEHRRSKYPFRAKRARKREEMKQLRQVQRSCTRDNEEMWEGWFFFRPHWWEYIYTCTPSQHLMRGHSHCTGSSVHSPCPQNIVVLCGWSWHYVVAPLTYI